MQDRARAGQNDTHRRRGGSGGGSFNRRPMEQRTECESAVGSSISSRGKEHHRPSLTPSHYGRCSAWGASADGCSTPPPSSPKSAMPSISPRGQKAISATNLRRPSLFQVPPSLTTTTTTPWHTLYFMVPSLGSAIRRWDAGRRSAQGPFLLCALRRRFPSADASAFVTSLVSCHSS